MVHNYGDKVYGEHDFAEGVRQQHQHHLRQGRGASWGPTPWPSYASAFGFGETLPWPLGGAKSVFPDPASMDKAHVAQASIGQGEVLATPLQMALAAAAVANERQDHEALHRRPGARLQRRRASRRPRPSVWLQPITAATAATMTDLMIEVVQQRHGNRGRDRAASRLQARQVPPKWPTASRTPGSPASRRPTTRRWWWSCWWRTRASGGSVAAPIARQVIAAALGLLMDMRIR